MVNVTRLEDARLLKFMNEAIEHAPEPVTKEQAEGLASMVRVRDEQAKEVRNAKKPKPRPRPPRPY